MGLNGASDGQKVAAVLENGELTVKVPPYIYCTPAYPELTPTEPPYGCDVEVNTAGVIDFSYAWEGCYLPYPLPCIDTDSAQNFYRAFYGNAWESFPTINTSSVTYFAYAWGYNYNLLQFPNLNISGGENFEGAWYDCPSLTTFPLLDFSNATNLGDQYNLNYGAWEECVNLESFPLINTSKVEKFDWTWHRCSSLNDFPKLDTSSALSFYATWRNCSSLTTFPAGMFDFCPSNYFQNAWFNCALSQQAVDNVIISIDTAGQLNGIVDIYGGTSSGPSVVGWYHVASLQNKGWTVTLNGPIPTWPPSGCDTFVQTFGVTDFSYAWDGCSFTEFPYLISSSVTDFSHAWNNCYNLTSFPEIDTSSGTDFTYSWAYTGLTSFPLIDTSSGGNFYCAWYNCSYLTEFPQLNVNQGYDLGYTWAGCTSLTSFPPLNLSSGDNFGSTWEGCSALTSFPNTIDLSSGTFFYSAWQDCTSLTSFPAIDLGSGTDFRYAWSNCSNLVTFPAGMFDTSTSITFDGAWLNCALSQQSVDNILVSLDTSGQLNGAVGIYGGTSSAPGAAGLTAKSSLQAKGWTVINN